MEEFTKTDPFQLVQNHLSCADLHSLATVNKYVYNYCKQLFGNIYMKKINNRLEDIFSDNTAKFLKLLDDENAYISGSFILQCLMNEHFNGSDIDIFLPDRHINHVYSNPSTGRGFSPVEDLLYKDLGYEWKDGNEYGSHIETKQFKISFIRTYAKNNVNIQFIHVGNSDTKEFIANTFDFNICKNIYRNKYLYVDSFEDIIYKETKFKYALHSGNSVERCAKYQKRGFIFTNLNDLCYRTIANDSVIVFQAGSEKIIRHITIMTEEQVYDWKRIIACPPRHNSLFDTACTNHNCVIRLCGKNSTVPHYHTTFKYGREEPDIIVVKQIATN